MSVMAGGRRDPASPRDGTCLSLHGEHIFIKAAPKCPPNHWGRLRASRQWLRCDHAGSVPRCISGQPSAATMRALCPGASRASSRPQRGRMAALGPLASAENGHGPNGRTSAMLELLARGGRGYMHGKGGILKWLCGIYRRLGGTRHAGPASAGLVRHARRDLPRGGCLTLTPFSEYPYPVLTCIGWACSVGLWGLVLSGGLAVRRGGSVRWHAPPRGLEHLFQPHPLLRSERGRRRCFGRHPGRRVVFYRYYTKNFFTLQTDCRLLALPRGN